MADMNRANRILGTTEAQPFFLRAGHMWLPCLNAKTGHWRRFRLHEQGSPVDRQVSAEALHDYAASAMRYAMPNILVNAVLSARIGAVIRHEVLRYTRSSSSRSEGLPGNRAIFWSAWVMEYSIFSDSTLMVRAAAASDATHVDSAIDLTSALATFVSYKSVLVSLSGISRFAMSEFSKTARILWPVWRDLYSKIGTSPAASTNRLKLRFEK